MSERLILWRITLPQVVRRMLPEALNLFISLFKATTIVSLIAVPDLMYNVSMVIQQEMRPLPLYTGAALTYFLIIFAALQRRARTSANAGAARSWRDAHGQLGTPRLEPARRSARRASPSRSRSAPSRSSRRSSAAWCCASSRIYVAPLRPIAILLIEFFRDTPIFVQLMWVAYVWPEVFGFPEHVLQRRLARARAAVERLSRRDLPRRHRSGAARTARSRLLRRHVAAADVQPHRHAAGAAGDARRRSSTSSP